MADLSSILGGMVQGFKDFGTGLVDMFGTGGAAIGDAIASIQSGRATTKNQDDFRKWLYQTDSTKDAAAKGLGTALNGVSTVADVIPGAQAVTANPLFNGIQGAIGGVADELKMNGENADWGRAAQRAGVGAASGLASGYAGQALGKSGNKLLSNGLTRGAVSGALGGGIANAGYTGIEGGSVQDMINAGLYGAQTGALVGGTTGLARELIKPAHKMDVAFTDEEKAARIANIDDQLGKLDLNTPEGNARYNELTQARQQYSGGRPKTVADLMNEPKQKTVADLMLSPEQKEYFKDSVIRDENGNLMPLYHGSNSKFTVFDSSKGGKSNKTAKVGHWFTPSKDAAEKWAGQAWWGDNEPSVYETYLNIKKPMVYESIDNSAPIKKLEVQLKQAEDRLNSTYRGSQEYYDAYREYNNIANEIDNLSYTDPYEQFRSHIYAMEGKTPSQANVGGVGMAMNDEDAAVQKYVDMLKSEGYDGIIIKGTGYDQNVMGGPNDQYVVFDSNQIKDINNLKPTDAPSIMESRMAPEELDLARALADQDLLVNNAKIAPGQLGLFDDMPTQTPKTGTRQTSLFDQPQEAEPVNPYAPVDGKLTQAMKDRYWELTSDANQFKYVGADNDLYNKINPDTLPKGYKELQHLLDTQDTPDNEVEIVLRDKVGTDRVWEADTDKLLDYVWGGDNHEKKMYYKSLEDEIAKARKNAASLGLENYNAEEEVTNAKRQDLQLKAYQKAELEALDKVMQVSDTDDIMNALANYRRRGVRTGEPGALDTVLSERLGIAPGNTIKITKNVGGDLSKSAVGRYARNARDIATAEMNTPEGKVSTMAHERLHSFQNEARPESAGRYDPEVTEAYKQLQKDLGHYYKSNSEIKKRYGSNVDYWASSGEQESRMFQQYLENKGYTDNSAWRKLGGKADEWGNEINPAFDKFIDKLRDLSKRGVALPALTALFGGGAIMAATQGDDKKKKSEVK